MQQEHEEMKRKQYLHPTRLNRKHTHFSMWSLQISKIKSRVMVLALQFSSILVLQKYLSKTKNSEYCHCNKRMLPASI